jgi:hypothetical protein
LDTNSAVKRPSFLEETLAKTAPKHEPEVELATYKEARQVVPTPMLDVVFRSGKIRSFSYAYLAEVEYEPGDTLTIKFSNGAAVVVEGRNLKGHRQTVRLHRADEIRECTESELALQHEEISQVERISITEGD